MGLGFVLDSLALFEVELFGIGFDELRGSG